MYALALTKKCRNYLIKYKYKKCEHIVTKYSVLMQIYRNYILRVCYAAAIAFLCQQHTQRTQKKDERSTYLVPRWMEICLDG